MLNIYRRFPINIIKGQGIYLFDDKGKKYLDFTSGIATISFGHCNFYIKEKLEEQLASLWHCSNLFNIPIQERVANRLINLTFADQIFFCSSGLEAIEAAIKFIRRYFYVKEQKKARSIEGQPAEQVTKYKIITLVNGFHGRSMAGISAGGSLKSKAGYAPLLTGFESVAAGDIEELRAKIDRNTAAVLLETIQSEGGVYSVCNKDKDYIKKLRALCDEQDLLLCFDEVQTGFGRTGELFHYQKFGIEPDILTSAKAIGNGFPLGACLMKQKIADALIPGCHGSTYAGNPLAMVVLDAILDILTTEGFLPKVKEQAKYLWHKLLQLAKKFIHIIKEIRGEGFLLGLEFFPHINTEEILEECLKRGLALTRTSNVNTIRILPPLIIEQKDTDEAVAILHQVLSNIL